MTIQVKLGYLPLTDSAPLIVASELGFFAEQNLKVKLEREISWANVRDRLVAGQLDAAQMLAPLPAMTALGVSGVRASLIYGLVLSRNGNAITVSNDLVDEMQNPNTLANAKSLLSGKTFAIVHTFSTHMILLRRWLMSHGLDPNSSVNYLVMPPSQMPDALESGLIDGFCVGEPWSTVAVEKGLGQMVALGKDVWPLAPEKVLAVKSDWHFDNTEVHKQLRIALMRSCAWIADHQLENSAGIASMLAPYLNVGTRSIRRSLSGELPIKNRENQISQNTDDLDFHVFHGDNVGQPNLKEQQQLIISCCDVLGKRLDDIQIVELAAEIAKPDLYDEAYSLIK